MMRFRFIRFIFATFVVISLCACKPRLLPDSSIVDTKENRAVTEFMNTYRQAIVAKDIDAIMALIAPDYYEDNAGRIKESSAYGYSKLREKLETAFSHTGDLTLMLHIQHVQRLGSMFEVVYYFNEQGQLNFPAGTEWVATADVNRMMLRMKGASLKDGLEIVSGL